MLRSAHDIRPTARDRCRKKGVRLAGLQVDGHPGNLARLIDPERQDHEQVGVLRDQRIDVEEGAVMPEIAPSIAERNITRRTHHLAMVVGLEGSVLVVSRIRAHETQVLHASSASPAERVR